MTSELAASGRGAVPQRRPVRAGTVATYLVLGLGAVLMVLPYLWMLDASVRTLPEVLQYPPTFWPHRLHLGNYLYVLQQYPFLRWVLNSAIVAVSITAGQLAICSMAAYAFARLRFWGRDVVFVLVLAALMVPQQVLLIPNFIIVQHLHLLNTLAGIIVPNLPSAFGTFLLRQYIRTLPREIDEAAILDGCSYFGVYWRIVLPLIGPALTALGIFDLVFGWNLFLWPLIVNTAPQNNVLAVGLALFQGEYGTDYPHMMAAACMASLPLIVAFLVGQRYFVEGIAFTSGRR
jgi:multiple sugar transport system permease protein